MLSTANPAFAGMSDSARQAYLDLLLFMADSELVIGHRHSEWTGFAPSAEEDVAFSSIAQDEMGHAHLYYALIAGPGDDEAIDHLVLDRGPRAFRHLPVLHAANGDWFFTTARHVYWDVFEDVLLRAALGSGAPLLASAAERVLNEEMYHLEHADQWLELLSSRPRQRNRLSRALARVATMGGNPMRAGGPSAAAAAGLLPGGADLAQAYATAVISRLTRNGWPDDEVASVATAIAAAPSGPAPAGLFKIHRDLTGLRRAHPGASW